MELFKDFYDKHVNPLTEEMETLLEKLITFNGQAYPKFGNILMMAGGAGSGKGFVLNKLVGMEGFVYDVDHLKSLVLNSKQLAAKVKNEFGIDLAKIDLKRGEDVAKLHYLIADNLGIDDKKQATLFKSILQSNPERRPNIIFDVTLKNLKKLQTIASVADNLGYDKRNVHLVWVVQHIDIAIKQNNERSRRVPMEILVATHRGASQTILEIISMGKDLSKYMDGDIVFAFNQRDVDTKWIVSKKDTGNFSFSDDPDGRKAGTELDKKTGKVKQIRGGAFDKTNGANYIYIKRAGKPVMGLEEIEEQVRKKISNYVPAPLNWA